MLYLGWPLRFQRWPVPPHAPLRDTPLCLTLSSESLCSCSLYFSDRWHSFCSLIAKRETETFAADNFSLRDDHIGWLLVAYKHYPGSKIAVWYYHLQGKIWHYSPAQQTLYYWCKWTVCICISFSHALCQRSQKLKKYSNLLLGYKHSTLKIPPLHILKTKFFRSSMKY